MEEARVAPLPPQIKKKIKTINNNNNNNNKKTTNQAKRQVADKLYNMKFYRIHRD